MKLGSLFTEMGVRHAELSDDYKTDDLSRDLSATAFTFYSWLQYYPIKYGVCKSR